MCDPFAPKQLQLLLISVLYMHQFIEPLIGCDLLPLLIKEVCGLAGVRLVWYVYLAVSALRHYCKMLSARTLMGWGYHCCYCMQ